MNDTTTTEDVTTNPQEAVTADTSTTDTTIDYKTKFSESSKEALRLLQETKEKDAEIERLRVLAEQANGTNYGSSSDALYPGFENLDEEAKANLVAYTDSIKKNTLDAVYKDPAIAFAKNQYNETTWLNAFESTASQYPQLRESKEDFKAKYFRADNVPSNIGDILKDLAKVYLFDKAQDIGAESARIQAERIEIERAGGGDKTPKASKTLEDWDRLAKANPAEFAKQSKQFNEDMASGKLK